MESWKILGKWFQVNIHHPKTKWIGWKGYNLSKNSQGKRSVG